MLVVDDGRRTHRLAALPGPEDAAPLAGPDPPRWRGALSAPLGFLPGPPVPFPPPPGGGRLLRPPDGGGGIFVAPPPPQPARRERPAPPKPAPAPRGPAAPPVD